MCHHVQLLFSPSFNISSLRMKFILGIFRIIIPIRIKIFFDDEDGRLVVPTACYVSLEEAEQLESSYSLRW
jgi:hypothetical protein